MRSMIYLSILLYSVFIMGCTDDLVYNSTQDSAGNVENTGVQKGSGFRNGYAIESDIHYGINRIRGSKGLAGLKRDERLDRVAREYSERMAQTGTISHVDSSGNSLEDRLDEFGITDWTQAGENLASSTAGAEPAQSALWGWQRSPGHLENILLPTFAYTGIGVYRDPVSKEVFITQLFLTP